MSDLPEGWEVHALGDIAEVVQGQSPPGASYNTSGNGLPFFQGKAEFGALHPVPRKWCTDPKKIAQPGDVLISIRAPVGPTNLASVRCCIGRGLAAIRPGSGISSRYLLHYLRSSAHLLADQATGSTFSAISGRQLRAHPVPVAPPECRASIVEAIESHLSRLDDAVAGLERVQRNLKRYRVSVLQAAVEGRLVPTEAELARAEGRDYEPASELLKRILVERRCRWEEAELEKLKAKGKPPKDGRWKKKYKEPVEPDTSELPELPEGWCWASMDQLSSRITSGSRDWSKFYDRGESVFLMAQNVRPGRLDLAYKQLIDPPPGDPSRERSQVRRGDLLVTIVGANTGDVCRVPEELADHFVCQSVALMRPVDASLSTFVDCYLNSPPGQAVYGAFIYGQGRPHLSFEHLRLTPIPLPPLLEQERLNESVERSLSLAAHVRADVHAAHSRFGGLRTSILAAAFSGRLVQDRQPGSTANATKDRVLLAAQ